MAGRSIQNNLRRLRFNAGEMTQQEVADKVAVSRQTIVAIEKGNYSPSLELAFRIAHLFKTPLEEVFTYDPEKDTGLKNNKKKK
jgi:putative transcriptional regulator